MLRPESRDFWAVLLFWILRRPFLPLVALGIIPVAVAVAVAGRLDENLAAGLDTPQELLSAVFSPLWLLAIATVLRIATAAAEYVFAFYSPSADSGYPSDPADLTRLQRPATSSPWRQVAPRFVGPGSSATKPSADSVPPDTS